MRHRFDPLCSNAQLRQYERKLYDRPTASALYDCAVIHASGLGRYPESLANCPPMVGLWVSFHQSTNQRENQ